MVAIIHPDLIFPSIFRKFDFDLLLSLQGVSTCTTILKKSPLSHDRKEWVGEDVDWIGTAQIRGIWRAPGNTALNLRVP